MQSKMQPTNKPLSEHLSEIRVRSWRRRMLRQAGLLACAVMLTVLVLSLAGCGSNPPVPCAPLPSPLMPALTEPALSVSYSTSAAQRIKSWGQQLTDSPLTDKH